MVTISSWGNTKKSDHQIIPLFDRHQVSTTLQHSSLGIPYGMGRSYGDACLNPHGILWDTKGLNRFIHFDESTGRIQCEAGMLLQDIQRLIAPRGWMLPVTPGTQLITLGGAIANDVHGKNYHQVASFGNHILGLKLVRTNGEMIECGPQFNSDWFAATVGGVGLTGVIIAAEIQLQPLVSPWLKVETIPYAGIQEFIQMADASEEHWQHTVAWFDCLSKNGRGLFMRAKAIKAEEKGAFSFNKMPIPITPPLSLINRFTLKPFNNAYYYLKKRKAHSCMHYESFLYPLDKLHAWNRLYGPKGFFQYQMLIPQQDKLEILSLVLKEIALSGQGSFLSVLKTFNRQHSLGMLSFPQHGVTLALDFPNRGADTFKLFQRLDKIVYEARGRIYLAKDACMSKKLFEQGYPRLQEFLTYRDVGISSALSRRLMGR